MYKENYKEIPKNDVMFDMDIENAVSVNEFTGMLPRPPKDKNEEENYQEVLNYSPQTIDVFQQKKER